MPEIAEAHALLAALAETDDVKAEAAQRQRLTQLHVSYGNALIAAQGYGAPETTEAFARARELATGDQDTPERLAVDYGLWVGSYLRGELPPMRAHAVAFLAESPLRPTRRRPASRIVRRGSPIGLPESTARPERISNARSPSSNLAATTIWPFALDMTLASARCSISQLHCGR